MTNIGMKGMRKLQDNKDAYSVNVRAKLKGSASQRRKIAQTLNALKRSPNLTEQQKVFIALLKDKKFLDLLLELIALNLKDVNDVKRRDKIFEQVISLIKGSPSINILNLQQKTENILSLNEYLKKNIDEKREYINKMKAKDEKVPVCYEIPLRLADSLEWDEWIKENNIDEGDLLKLCIKYIPNRADVNSDNIQKVWEENFKNNIEKSKEEIKKLKNGESVDREEFLEVEQT